ncbi:MAG: MBL fold metallo-hydrolase [Spirochaetia bacterium]|nr:MBL fold metallo-hydrolase [Spirochaetia bacterium]
MLRYAVLGSGSSGNSYVFTDGATSILIDQGFSVAELTRRLSHFSIDISSIQSVFVTHLHPDHARGVGILARKRQVSVYMHEKTVVSEPVLLEKLNIPSHLLHAVGVSQCIEIGPFSLFCFDTSHDSTGSVGWYLLYENQKIMVLTDTGLTTFEHHELAKEADLLFLEANYDEQMLEEGPYPKFLKKRISGSFGHLSNTQALSFLSHSHFSGKHIYFIHLSDINNNPDLLQTVAHKTLLIPFTVCLKGRWYGSTWEELS